MLVSQDARQEIAVTTLLMPNGRSLPLCMWYYPDFKPLPQGPDAADVLNVISFRSQSSCEKPYGINFKDKVVLIQDSGNCTLRKAMQIYKDAGAYGIIIALDTNKVEDIIVESTASSVTDLVIIIAGNRTAAFLEKYMIPKQPHPAKVFTKDLEFEPGLTVIWLLAVFSVGGWFILVGKRPAAGRLSAVERAACAACTRAACRYECELHSRQMRRRRLSSSSAASQGAPSRPQGMNVIEEDSSLDISPIWVLSFVVFMATMLVVLYFFIRYLGLPDGAVPCFHGSLEVRQALVLLAAMAVPAFWIYIRHHPLSWIMQDLLGVCFSVYILRVVRMPNLKICTMLLSILFFYDIFFVFLTPHFIPPAMMHNTTTSFVNATGKGDSIMVEVARGGGSKEQIPMLMRVPRYGNQDISPCLNPYSLLGFGDILVPGLLVAFLRGFDLISVGGCLYFPVALICYGLGLMMTFVGLYLMRTAQPALLYLVPFTVIPTLPEEPSLLEGDVSGTEQPSKPIDA
ncbi:hypothetical protein MRX96_051455 [Rhipicephalus microplus]